VKITDAQAQQAKTGQSPDQVLASLDTSVRTGKDSSNSLAKNWNGNELREDVEAQAKITQAFGQQAAKMVGSYADAKEKELRQAASTAAQNGDQTQANQLNADADQWKEGGAYRAGAHAAIGLLAGGVSGALGAAASSALMPDVAEQIKKLGLPTEVQSVVSLAAAAGIGAAVGGSTGAASAYNVDLNNRQLHQVDRNNAKRLAALAKEKGLNYSEQDILAMLQRSGVVDEKGNVLVPADTQEIYVKGIPLKNGSATLPLTDNQIQNPPFAVRTDGTAAIEILPNVNNPELADFIAKNSTGYYFSPVVLPTQNTAASAALPPAPIGTRRVPVVVDGVAYFPLVANCPAASCAGGDPIAGALGDASTQAYLDAINRKSEKDLNIATSAAGILGAAIRGIKAVGSLVDAALAERGVAAAASGAGKAVAEVDAGSVKGFNPTGSTQNCTNCVAVVDNWLTTGNPASALPRAKPVPFDQLGPMYGTKFSGWTTQQSIESSLLAAGDGTRAVIYGTDGTTAHVWNAVVQNGKVNYIDGQIGGGGASNFKAFTNVKFGVLP